MTQSFAKENLFASFAANFATFALKLLLISKTCSG